MKKSFLVYVLFFLTINGYSQKWIHSNAVLGDEITPLFSSLNEDGSALYYLAEFSDDLNLNNETITSNGDKDLILLKLSSSGVIVWAKQIGSTAIDVGGGIINDNLGNVYISGTFSGTCDFSGDSQLTATNGFDFYLAKYSPDGNFLWAKIIGSSTNTQSSLNISFDNDYDLVLSGFYRDSLILGTGTERDTLLGNGYISNFISKHDSTGTLLWSKNILGTNNFTRIYKTAATNEGYYFAGQFIGTLNFDIGQINTSTSKFDVFIYKTDFSGNGVWLNKIYGQLGETLHNLALDDYDNVYFLGNYESSTLFIDSKDNPVTQIDTNEGGWDTFIGKYNREGILQWIQTKGGSQKDVYKDISIKGDIIYATGYFADTIIFNQDTLTSEGTGNEDVFLVGFNSIGDAISGISIKGVGNSSDGGITIDSDDALNAYISGYFESSQITIGDSIYTSETPGNRNLFFAKYSHPFKAAFTNENYISCQGYSDGMLTVTPYFGVPPYSYNWTKDGSPIIETDSVAEGLDAGLYRVNVTDSRDSITTVQVSLTNPTPISIGYVTDEVSCYSGNDGGIDITATGGNNNYVYSWSGGTGLSPTSEDQTGLIAADYTVTVTDKKGCTASQTITLGQAEQITFGESVIISTNADVDTGRVDLVVNGGTEPYASYAWEGPDGYLSIESSIDSLNGGNYSLTVTDANSCIGDTTFLVPNDSIFIAYMTNITDITCGDLTDGFATVSSNRSEWPVSFKYVWIDLEDSVQIGSSQNSISGLDSSEYRVYLIDLTNFDTTFVEFEISKPALLTVNSGAANPLCYGGSDGYINAIVSGGTLPYSYEWSNGSTNEDLSSLQAGTYTLTVTDGNSCTATTEEVLENPEVINITFDFTDPLCPGTLTGIATADATGGGLLYDYAWNDPGNQTDGTATGLGAGTYTVTVTDQNGCLETDAVTLTDPLPVSVISVDTEDATCYGISDGWMKVTAEGGSGSYTYNWSHIGLGADSVGNVGASTYYVTVTDENDCTPAIETIIINEPIEIIVDIDTVDNICFGENNGQITVSPIGGSGSFDYTWGHTSTNSGVLTSLAAGTYYLTLSDGFCPDLSYDIPVAEPEEIVVSIDTTDISCLNATDGGIAITTTGGTGGYSYAWSHDAITAANITVADPGNYTVTISDGACPELVYNIPINEPDSFMVDIDTVVTNCFNIAGGAITVTPTGGSEDYSFTWSHTSDNVNQVTDLTYGSYDVTISDGSCPDITANIFVDQPDPLVFDIDTTDVSCLGYNNGAISVNVTGGSGSYTYTWGHTALNVSELGGLSAANYDLTISDGACPDSALSIPVSEPEELLVSLDKEDVTCYNANDGSIQVNISGGSENYDITWGHTTEKVVSVTNLSAGDYSVTVDDGNCPIESETIEITEPEQLLIAGYDSVNLSASGAYDGEIILHVTGGTEPYRYALNSGAIQADSVFNNLDAGKYKIIVNDANNCGPIATDSIELVVMVGITNYWEQSTITYYPNPADEKVTIEINDLKTNFINLKVINSMGSLLMNKEIEIPNRKNLIELETGHLSQGIYFILIDNMRLKTPLIIK